MMSLTDLVAFMRTEFLCISVLRVASGPRVKLVTCKSALTRPVVYRTHSGYFENRIPLKPVLGGVSSIANYSVAYEETQSNRFS